MTIRPVQMFELLCDADPQCSWWDDGETDGAPVWGSEAAALAGAESWGFRVADGRMTCPAHVCAEQGHDWGGWRPTVVVGVRGRWCGRCREGFEEDPPVTDWLPTESGAR